MSAAETEGTREPSLNSFDDMLAGDVRDPYPEFVRLRQESPVLRQEPSDDGAQPSFVVYRHADVTQVLRDGETFSSAVIADGMRDVWGRKIIVGMDAPEHHRHRALVSVAFRQRTLARWEDSLVGRVVDELIDQFINRGRVDLVDEYTFAFPAKVISGVLGLPEEDHQQFQQWAVGIITVYRDWDRAIQYSRELREYLSHVVAARRSEPRDDLITDLVTAELDRESLDDEEIYSFLRMLLPAGIETTYRSSGNLLFLLLTHPDQLAAVQSDLMLLPQAIEEGLRYESPVLLTPRVTTTETVLGGVEIPAGAIVTSMLGSANAIPTRTTTRSHSTSSGTPSSTCRSVPVRISASGCTSPAWKRASHSTRSSTVSPICGSITPRPSASTRTSTGACCSAVRPIFPSPGTAPDPKDIAIGAQRCDRGEAFGGD